MGNTEKTSHSISQRTDSGITLGYPSTGREKATTKEASVLWGNIIWVYSEPLSFTEKRN